MVGIYYNNNNQTHRNSVPHLQRFFTSYRRIVIQMTIEKQQKMTRNPFCKMSDNHAVYQVFVCVSRY